MPEHVVDPGAKAVAGMFFVLMEHVDGQLQIDEPEGYAGKAKYQRGEHGEKTRGKERGIGPLPLANQPTEDSSGHVLFLFDR